ncbi:unnamed protein product [Hermetia illucens]|uniref:Uncharacterized protein n=1 Tax=Hermetia illucens TaxID=343691 RepID=A0A7R8UZY3_HERIL|nr:unnamed protein product [Hermetia illucens]
MSNKFLPVSLFGLELVRLCRVKDVKVCLLLVNNDRPLKCKKFLILNRLYRRCYLGDMAATQIRQGLFVVTATIAQYKDMVV